MKRSFAAGFLSIVGRLSFPDADVAQKSLTAPGRQRADRAAARDAGKRVTKAAHTTKRDWSAVLVLRWADQIRHWICPAVRPGPGTDQRSPFAGTRGTAQPADLADNPEQIAADVGPKEFAAYAGGFGDRLDKRLGVQPQHCVKRFMHIRSARFFAEVRKQECMRRPPDSGLMHTPASSRATGTARRISEAPIAEPVIRMLK